MGSDWLQFVAGGLTAGAIYALVALGYSIVYNASHAINFAQGEFVMLAALIAATFLAAKGMPVIGAIAGAVLVMVAFSFALERIKSTTAVPLGYAAPAG